MQCLGKAAVAAGTQSLPAVGPLLLGEVEGVVFLCSLSLARNYL